MKKISTNAECCREPSEAKMLRGTMIGRKCLENLISNAMELRYRPRARTTRDVDLASCKVSFCARCQLWMRRKRSDSLLMIETDAVPPEQAAEAVRRARAASERAMLPMRLAEPLKRCAAELDCLATDANLAARDLASAFEVLREFWHQPKLMPMERPGASVFGAALEEKVGQFWVSRQVTTGCKSSAQ